MSNFPAVDIKEVSVVFGGVEILKNVNVHIERACITAIIGPNGAGKTTLLNVILGLIPFSGTVSFCDSNGVQCRPRLAYVPQKLEFDPQSSVTVLDFMVIRYQRRPLWLGHSKAAVEASRDALAQLKSEHLLHQPIGKLSGGEIQRVLLAIALRSDPQIILLDEPISGVDVAGGHLFCDILDKIRLQKKVTIVMVSHDLSVVSQHVDRAICLNRSVVLEGTTPEVLTSENLFAIYGLHAGLFEQEAGTPAPPCDLHDSHDHSSNNL